MEIYIYNKCCPFISVMSHFLASVLLFVQDVACCQFNSGYLVVF
jgi:hypothetical protein